VLIGSILASWHVRRQCISVPGSRLVRLFLAGMVTVLALVWMGKLVGGSNRACQRYPYAAGCR
jgi:cytochrome c oxidase assembly factor CtaG